MQKTRTTISKITFLITLVVVLMTLAAIIFPALYHHSFGNYPDKLESQFEIGHQAYLIICGNIVIFAIGFAYYKNKIPFIGTKIDQIRQFEISKKISVIILIIILGTYVGFSTPELFLDEREQWADYIILEEALEYWPGGESKIPNPYIDEQLDRHVRLVLLDASVKIFQNIKILPFLASILVVFFTYLLTVQLTGKRFAGIISMLVLLQSHIFLTFDTIAVYENFWVLFYLISIYLINIRWRHTSPIAFLLSIFTKAFTATYFWMNLFFIYRSEIPKKSKLIREIKKNYLIKTEEMVDQMIKLGQNESTTLYYNPEEWIFFDDLLKEIPILENYSKIQFIKRKKKTILEYNDFIYFVNIYDYIIKNGTSPLSFEVNKIKSIILNQRSKDLRKKLRLDLYDDGIKNSYIEKYRL